MKQSACRESRKHSKGYESMHLHMRAWKKMQDKRCPRFGRSKSKITFEPCARVRLIQRGSSTTPLGDKPHIVWFYDVSAIALSVLVVRDLALDPIAPRRLATATTMANQMKRPILLSALIVILAVCYSFWGHSSDRKPFVQASSSTVPQRKAEVIVAPRAASSAASAVALPEAKPLLTDTRRRIMDSRDLMKTVAEIRLHGTQDEKDWALAIMMTCGQVRSMAIPPGGGDAASEPSATIRVTSRDVARERKLAYESIMERCKGIYALSAADRRSLQSELVAGSATNSSELAKLHSLATTPEDRWSDEQAKLISSSLYGGDPVLQREAFFAAQRAIDVNAPGGDDRSEALERAFRTELGLGPLDDLERQTACVMINHCPSSVADQNTSSRSVDRLADEYRVALQAHKDVKSILAIR